MRFQRSIFPRPWGFPGRLCTSLMSSTAADQASWCGVGAAVVAVEPLRAAVGLDRVVQRGLHAQGVLAVAPAVPDHIPGVVVEQREQHRPAALDDRAVQPVADPQLVGFGGLEPAEHLRRHAVRAGGQLQAGEVALQGARRRRPPLLLFDDPGDVRGGAGRVFPLEPRGQLQHLGVGARGTWRSAGISASNPPARHARIQRSRLARDTVTGCPGRAQMHLGGQLAHQPAALDRRQARIGQRPDQRIPVQRDIPRPIRPRLLPRSTSMTPQRFP